MREEKKLNPTRPNQNKTIQNRTKFSRPSFDNCKSLGKMWVQDTWSTDLTSMKDWLQILWEDFFKIRLYNRKFLCPLIQSSVFSQNLWSHVEINSVEIMSGSLIMTLPKHFCNPQKPDAYNSHHSRHELTVTCLIFLFSFN